MQPTLITLFRHLDGHQSKVTIRAWADGFGIFEGDAPEPVDGRTILLRALRAAYQIPGVSPLRMRASKAVRERLKIEADAEEYGDTDDT